MKGSPCDVKEVNRLRRKREFKVCLIRDLVSFYALGLKQVWLQMIKHGLLEQLVSVRPFPIYLVSKDP
ncbi:hypothetical protein L1987_27665 [Smallanthus sonchifolius]|uniref:Uncharacterized protein n=1 Tax=Smallanthus sonchifolius TaxID=185202 RepID=A0ACB9ID86_9ASTR|nr:hypothetical protein L1987_27665 [Smallanthus sonchifolius]